MTEKAPTRRCAEHDLAVGPDGLCAVCRRGTRPIVPAPVAATEPASFDFTRVLLGVAGLASLLGLGLAMSPQGLLGFDPLARPAVARATMTPLPRQPQPPRLVGSTLQADAGAAPFAAAKPPPANNPNETPTEPRARLEREHQQAEQDRARHQAVEQQLGAEQLVAARRNVAITMYSTSWCGYCSRARAYMQEKGIAYTDFDIEHDGEAHARAKLLNPSGSVPVITIDDLLMVGFSEESLEDHIDRAARARAGI